MELRQLHTFCEVARSGSFTRAAATLDYAQSSVSSQMQSLEEELGVSLFDRLGRRTVVTEAGERLVYYASKILGLADEAKLAVPGLEEPTGTGATASGGAHPHAPDFAGINRPGGAGVIFFGSYIGLLKKG